MVYTRRVSLCQAGGSHTRRTATDALEQPGAARHERCNEDNRHDQPEFRGVNPSIGFDWEAWRRCTFAPRDPDTNEGGHRRQLEDKDHGKQREFHPEEPVAPVEARLLASKKHTQETRSDPQKRRNAPGVVSRKKPLPAVVTQRARKRAAAREDRRGPERQREQVDCRERSRDHHPIASNYKSVDEPVTQSDH